MNNVLIMLERWKLDVKAVRERMYRAPTLRERERWHALWLLARGWSAAHTIGDWVEDFRQKGPAGLAFEQTGGSPPSSARRNKPS